MTQQPAPVLSPEAEPPRPRRLHHVDNLRVALTVLVVLHHVALTYGNIPVWYYTEPAQDPTGGLLDLVVIINQTYFMGLFFLLAGYFVPGARDRRGRRGFVRERLVRLGVPLLLFVLLVRPLITTGAYRLYAEGAAAQGAEMPYWLFYLVSFDPGPMWFVEVLLVLSLTYVMVRGLRERRAERRGAAVGPVARPEDTAPLRWFGPVVAFTVGLAVVSFLWRWVNPAPYWPFVGLPSPDYLPQYAALFTVGVFAYRGNWFTRLPGRAGWYGIATAVLGLVAFLVLPVVSGVAAVEPGTAAALSQMVAESFFTIGVTLALMVFFRRFLDRRTRFSGFLVDNAFAVYFLHPLVLVGLGMALSGWEAAAAVKFLVMAALAIPACWALAGAVRAVPGARRVL
ncbi:acyltransferase family protein [Nocardiopsis sp. CT-R113]|uniref:Acyltransferase family protein n=1 Tax=Nocardiopsis codii TaxID=3065942 RepID=A0ABU7K444_9ACTN|nr:acyltransferase family protein [Nocardiopsis sp. CT-R113]MEE2037025.1 acyltransferase family protein [Nocardiopsis sp. CT-R113]